MIALTVTLRVKPGHLDGFLDAITANAEATFAEPGCRYFDINQALDDDHTFTFYELYVDEEAAAAHRTYPHFARWREAVGEHGDGLPSADQRGSVRGGGGAGRGGGDDGVPGVEKPGNMRLAGTSHPGYGTGRRPQCRTRNHRHHPG